MNDSLNNCSSCIFDILKKILILQKRNHECDNFSGCDKPFLGPTITDVCYDTRPIQLFGCCTGTPWTFDYTTTDGVTGSSSILRVESLDDCCCTCRILYFDTTTSTYQSTDEFVTIDLNCCGAIRCYSDIFLNI